QCAAAGDAGRTGATVTVTGRRRRSVNAAATTGRAAAPAASHGHQVPWRTGADGAAAGVGGWGRKPCDSFETVNCGAADDVAALVPAASGYVSRTTATYVPCASRCPSRSG